jgi:hypothetical protein
MGIPGHYSRELPERCMRLIDTLLPRAEQVRMPGAEHLGPLTTTFLLALATPMILLPLERVRRHRDESHGAYMNERPLDEELASAIDSALGSRCLRHSPFFTAGQWRFATMPYGGENFALHFPPELEQALEWHDAQVAADNMPAEQWSSCLRNALAHGGVAYLDDYGRQTHGGAATALAFISARYPRGDGPQAPDQLRALRIKEADFLSFLRQWAQWLSEVGLSQALAA